MVTLGSNTYAYPRRGDGVHTDHQASIHTARSDAAKSTRQTMVDPWRMRCPEGHSSLLPERDDGRYKCVSCGRRYADGPFDAAETEFPVEGVGSWVEVSTADVLDRFVDVVGGDTEMQITSQRLVASNQDGRKVGQQLATLRDRGFVEAAERSTRYRWRLTESGLAEARSTTPRAVVADD